MIDNKIYLTVRPLILKKILDKCGDCIILLIQQYGTDVMIKINPASFIPIYEQVKQQLKSRISLGILGPDEPLPSIRDMATSLIINPNTVARAYRELEQEGYIYTRKGKGCYISKNSQALINKEKEEIVASILDEAISEAKKYEKNNEKIKKAFEGIVGQFK